MSLNRRDFLLGGGVLGALAAGGVLVPLGFVLRDEDQGAGGATGAVLAEFPRTRVGSVGAISSDPTFFDYPFEGQSNIAVKVSGATPTGVGSGNDIVAYSNVCTHMGCTITDFDAAHDVLGPCPCHFTTFDLAHDGQVTLGQATQNLPQVRLEVDGDDLYATGIFRLVYGYDNTLSATNVSIAGGV